MNSATVTPVVQSLKHGIHRIYIAPIHDNLKVDRVVVHRRHREKRALDLATPQARYHPWVNK
jgi:hypothetical protein